MKKKEEKRESNKEEKQEAKRRLFIYEQDQIPRINILDTRSQYDSYAFQRSYGRS